MTESLELVINQIKNLPPEIQDAIATRLREELQEELAWSNSFAETTEQQWTTIANQVRQEITQGYTYPLEEITSNSL